MGVPAAPSFPGVLAAWAVEPLAVIALAAAGLAYARGSRSTPPRRRRAFYCGLAVLGLALVSPVDTYAEALLSVHMAQHLMLAMVAAPLLVAGLAPLPVGVGGRLGGRLSRVATSPPVAWLVFAAVGWVVHFSPLFDAALEHRPAHVAMHALFLGSALLFWAPVFGRRPLPHGLRLLYLAVAMPQNTFLAVAVLSSGRVLYPLYAEVAAARGWGPSALADQRQGAGLMWVGGDLVLLVAALAVAAAWARHERAAALSEGGAGPPPWPRTAG